MLIPTEGKQNNRNHIPRDTEITRIVFFLVRTMKLVEFSLPTSLSRRI
jgi:hypothetical protein